MLITEITANKGRTIDFSKPVHVYRNLNRKGKIYSIRQGGYVVGYTTSISLMNCEFMVSQSGKNRAIQSQVRNVHAYIKAFITEFDFTSLSTQIKYWPFNGLGFYFHENGKEVELHQADRCIIGPDGVFLVE